MKIANIISKPADFHFIEAKADNLSDEFFELRIDFDIQLLDLLHHENVDPSKIIVTYRSKNEGGKGEADVSITDIEKWLSLNPGFIDLELERDAEILKTLEIQEKNTTFILSKHVSKAHMHSNILEFIAQIPFPKIPENVVLKFVSPALDTWDIFKSLSTLKKTHSKYILLGMNYPATVLRTRGKQVNNTFVYGSVNNNVDILSHQQLSSLNNDRSCQYGLIGGSIESSLSPRIHHSFYDHTQMKSYYHQFELHNSKNLLPLIEKLQNLGIRGLNITNPYKEAVCKLSASKSDLVNEVNAANTIKFDGSQIYLENTDVTGFSRFYTQHNLHKHKNVIVYGSGGVAKAIIKSLLDLKCSIMVVSRSSSRFDNFPHAWKNDLDFVIQDKFNAQIEDEVTEYSLFINATPIRFYGQNSGNTIKIPLSIKVFLDISYTSKIQTGQNSLEQRGMLYFDGKEMLFHQAADAFEFWTEKTIDREQLKTQYLGGLM